MNCICEIDTSLFSVALSDLPCLPHLSPSLDVEENVLYQNNIKYTWHQQWPISNVQGPYTSKYWPIFSYLHSSASPFNCFALEMTVKPGSQLSLLFKSLLCFQALSPFSSPQYERQFQITGNCHKCFYSSCDFNAGFKRKSTFTQLWRWQRWVSTKGIFAFDSCCKTEEQLAERCVRLPTRTHGAPNMARLPSCKRMGQQKGGDYRNKKEVLELGKSKWQQRTANITRQSCAANWNWAPLLQGECLTMNFQGKVRIF